MPAIERVSDVLFRQEPQGQQMTERFVSGYVAGSQPKWQNNQWLL